MNAVNGIFMAVALIFSGGYALDKIYIAVKRAAVEHVHHGMPPLSRFTNRLTCSHISMGGELQRLKCKRTR